MKTMECSVMVDESRKATLQFPPDVPPGEHQLVVLIDEQPTEAARNELDDLPPLSVGPWPAELSLRREDLYGNTGR